MNNDKDVAAVGEELQFSISVNIKGLDVSKVIIY